MLMDIAFEHISDNYWYVAYALGLWWAAVNVGVVYLLCRSPSAIYRRVWYLLTLLAFLVFVGLLVLAIFVPFQSLVFSLNK